MNRLQRQIEGLLANYKALESGLEARGIAVKEIVTPSIEKTTEWVYGRSPTKSDGRLSGMNPWILVSTPISTRKWSYSWPGRPNCSTCQPEPPSASTPLLGSPLLLAGAKSWPRSLQDLPGLPVQTIGQHVQLVRPDSRTGGRCKSPACISLVLST